MYVTRVTRQGFELRYRTNRYDNIMELSWFDIGSFTCLAKNVCMPGTELCETFPHYFNLSLGFRIVLH